MIECPEFNSQYHQKKERKKEKKHPVSYFHDHRKPVHLHSQWLSRSWEALGKCSISPPTLLIQTLFGFYIVSAYCWPDLQDVLSGKIYPVRNSLAWASTALSKQKSKIELTRRWNSLPLWDNTKLIPHHSTYQWPLWARLSWGLWKKTDLPCEGTWHHSWITKTLEEKLKALGIY
jgi:hypothetical protein